MAKESDMSLTNPKDFSLFWSLIPREKRENIWLFPIRANRKNAEVPAGTILKGNLSYRLSYDEAVHRLRWGSNVGIYALQGGLCFLDLDVLKGKLLASQEFLDALELNPTLTIRSRNGGIQKYFWNDGTFPNQSHKNENKEEVWSLRTDWYYVVSVGSHVESDEEKTLESDGTYRIIKELPIAQFRNFGDYFKKNDEISKEELKTFSQKTDFRKIEEYQKSIEGKTKRKLTIPELNFLKLRGKIEL